MKIKAYPVGQNAYVASLGAGSTGYTGLGLVITPEGKPMMYTEDGTPEGEAVLLYGPDVLCLDSWYHLAVTWNAGARTIFVDGTAVATDTVGYTSNPLGGNPLVVGYDPNSTRHFDGQVDEFGYFDGALSETEWQHIWSDGHCNVPLSVGAVPL